MFGFIFSLLIFRILRQVLPLVNQKFILVQPLVEH